MVADVGRGDDGRKARRRRVVVAALVVAALVAAFFLHFLLERRQRRLVALELGEPLEGRPVAPHPGPTPAEPLRVWIETDAGCGLGDHVDVDDCFALAMALAAPELDVRGIGTVFGNVPLAAADSVTRELVRVVSTGGARVPPVHRGAAKRGESASDASRALGRELEGGPLTVLAFGPLTSLAAALDERPGRARNLAEVVLVGGKRPGQWMHPGYDHFITFSDFNVAGDPRAVRRVLAAGAPVTLVPFEAALKVTLTPADLEALARRGAVGRWLRERSGGWMEFWRREGGRDGFVPFDNAAVAYAVEPAMLECVAAYGRLERSPPWFGIGRPTELVVRPDPAEGAPVRYCGRTTEAFRAFLLRRLGEAAG
jgi:purine nucleosidase